MDVSTIVKAIDDHIATLQQARALLSATAVPATEKRAQAAVAAIMPRGNSKAGKAPAKATNGRKPMSDEGRARIAAAQKKRWALRGAQQAAEAKAARKQAAAKKAPATKSPAKRDTAKKVATKAPAAAVKKAAPVAETAPTADETTS